jgi:hypothetical protein
MARLDAPPGRQLLGPLLLTAGLLVSGCNQAPEREKGASDGRKRVVTAAGPVTNPCGDQGVQPVTLRPTLKPALFASASQQRGADCLAWQTFIALNWKADPSNPGQPDPLAPFGAPGDTAPVVWESYYEAGSVFAGANKSRLLWNAKRPAVKLLLRNSKFDGPGVALRGIGQAGPGYWLTAQTGELTYYEIMINEDEFMYITSKSSDLTTTAGQLACASGSAGLLLPTGANDKDCKGTVTTFGRGVGSIEIKAAWLALPEDHSLDYRYKTSIARITDPYGKVTQRTVGLVGLHIIRRLPNAPQLLWATFEQVDNTPNSGGNTTNSGGPKGWQAANLPENPHWGLAGKPPPGTAFRYTYFNRNCVPAKDKVYQCGINTPPARSPGNSPLPCDGGGGPTGCFPYSAPMQIVRMVPVDKTDANRVSAYSWSLMPNNSVFNYYRLINVQWPQNPATVPPGAKPPLPNGTITPSTASGGVANTTMETFFQGPTGRSCMDCHQNATIAAAPSAGAATPPSGGIRRFGQSRLAAARATGASKACVGGAYSSSYSFLFRAETRC